MRNSAKKNSLFFSYIFIIISFYPGLGNLSLCKKFLVENGLQVVVAAGDGRANRVSVGVRPDPALPAHAFPTLHGRAIVSLNEMVNPGLKPSTILITRNPWLNSENGYYRQSIITDLVCSDSKLQRHYWERHYRGNFAFFL